MLHESMDLLNAEGHDRAVTILKKFDDHLQKCSVCAEHEARHTS
jgi:hypothetical protein